MMINGKFNNFYVTENDEGKRVDRIVRCLCPSLPLSAVYRYIRLQKICLNRKKTKPDDRVKFGDEINLKIDIPIAPKIDNTYRTKKNKKIDISKFIIFKNKDILVINKPSNLKCHGHSSIAEIIQNRSFVEEYEVKRSLSFKPGPIHRLDCNTSGALIVALSLKGAREGTKLFRERAIKKIYCGIVEGKMDKENIWVDRILRNKAKGISIIEPLDSHSFNSYSVPKKEGKLSITKIIPILYNDFYSFVFFVPETGRTHQIRVQAKIHGHPLLADKKYGGKGHVFMNSFFLHCYALLIEYISASNIFPKELRAPLPADKSKFVSSLFGRRALSIFEEKIRDIKKYLNNNYL